ncbi:hypothetical protein PFDG_04878, partial [Plasmodium falciparum Dd2]
NLSLIFKDIISRIYTDLIFPIIKKKRGSKVYSKCVFHPSLLFKRVKKKLSFFLYGGSNSVLAHIDVLRHNGPVVFSRNHLLLDIYTCKEAILSIASFYKDLDKSSTTIINEDIEKFTEEIIKNQEHCLAGGKTDFDNLLIVLENAHTANVRKTLFDKKFNDYKNKKSSFYDWLKTRKNDYDKKPNNIENEITKLLKNNESTGGMSDRGVISHE